MIQHETAAESDALAGKAIFITGAASGLGAALCEVLAVASSWP